MEDNFIFSLESNLFIPMSRNHKLHGTRTAVPRTQIPFHMNGEPRLLNLTMYWSPGTQDQTQYCGWKLNPISTPIFPDHQPLVSGFERNLVSEHACKITRHSLDS